MRHFLTLLFCCSFLAAEAIEESETPLWDSKPEYAEVLPEFANENVIGLLLEERIDYYHNESGELVGKHSIHKKFRLNNEESINSFNKISVSLDDVIETLEIRARVIKPTGKVVEFDQNNIKEIKDDENGNAYKIFAIDGIEVGDDIEYFVLNQISASNFGRFFLQYRYPIQRVKFELSSPQKIVYDFKMYNGDQKVTHQLGDEERNNYLFELNHVEAIKNEKFNYETPRRKRLEYRLDYNLNKTRAQILTWDEAAQRLYNILYLNTDEKALQKWLNDIPVSGNNSVDKAKQIEEYLKTNVFVQEFHTPEFDDIAFVYENKMTSGRGMTGLMAKIFQHYGVAHEVVLSSPRDKVKFDPEFQSWNYLDKFLIYLPEADQYIDPADQSFRLGCFDGMLADEYGLAIHLVNIGDFQSAIGKITYIKAPGPDANYNHMYIQLGVDPDQAKARIEAYVGFKGLSGGYLSQIYRMIDEDRKREMLKSLMVIEAPDNDIELLEKVQAGENQDQISDAEMIIHSQINSNTFVEQAGNKLLLHLGKAIGPQVEMYFEDDRSQEAENQFNRSYYREIEFKVPDGYRIKNPEASAMAVIEKDGEDPLYVFDSTYSYEGQMYKVIIDEYYKQVYVPEKHFEGFKDVVNAAADFNKVVLVLEPM